jgi:membrane-bound lytic murein transglycosylase B
VRLVARAVVPVVLLVGLAAGQVAGQVVPSPASTAASPAPPPVRDPRLSPALDKVAVSSPDYDAAQARYAADWHELGQLHQRELTDRSTLAVLSQAAARLVGDEHEAVRRHAKASDRVAKLRASLSELVVAVYMADGTGGTTYVDRALVDSIGSDRLADLAVELAIASSTGATARQDRDSLFDVHRRQQATGEDLLAALGEDASLTTRLAEDRKQVADTRMTAAVVGTDLTLVTLDAYWRTASHLVATDRACHLRWPDLAGVARVESDNGTYGGDSVGADGEEASPIIGIALDGKNGTAVVHDTDGGALDHDSTYDRAVGPLQVLPSSWERYGVDGNGDGRADPQNYYDAVATAAAMLCRFGSLADDAGLRTAYFHYNPSNAYVDEVLSYAHLYATFKVP